MTNVNRAQPAGESMPDLGHQGVEIIQLDQLVLLDLIWLLLLDGTECGVKVLKIPYLEKRNQASAYQHCLSLTDPHECNSSE